MSKETKKHISIWREPAVQTNAFPNLMVHDNCVTGSINVRDTRLPLWAIITTAINEGWEEVERGWEPEKNYGYTKEHLSHFLYCLLEQRGEFGRLLLYLANAENVSECWWETKTHRKKIIAQLGKCLKALESLDQIERV
jgi:hypothetical protein